MQKMIHARMRAIVPVLSALLVIPGVAAAGPDPCAAIGATTASCSGVQSAGVFFSDPITTLTVGNLSFDIDPATGVLGIGLASSGANGSAVSALSYAASTAAPAVPVPSWT
jgi:hypothetical protein